MLSDLIMGPEREKWSGEGVLDAQTTTRAFGLRLSGSPTIVSDDDRLYQDIEFQTLGAVSGLFADVVDRRIEPVCLPADLVALTIGEGATEHCHADDVGVVGRMSEGPLAVDTNE